MKTENDALVLVLAAQPKGTPAVQLDQEVRKIRRCLREADFRDRIRFESYWATQPDDVLQALNQHKPQVVHFSGHGTADSKLVLSSVTGNAQLVGEQALVSLFRCLGDNVRVVVLNSCFSYGQAAAIAEEVGIAIGMSEAIGIDAAIVFSAAFYQGLGYGKSIQKSFELGLVALGLYDIPQQHVPVLCSAAWVDTSEVCLFDSAESVGEAAMPHARSPRWASSG